MHLTIPNSGNLHSDTIAVEFPSSLLHPLLNPTMAQQWRSVMTENTHIPTAQNIIEDPPEYNAENAKGSGEDYGQTKGGSDWLGGPTNRAQIPAVQNSNNAIDSDPSNADHEKGYGEVGWSGRGRWVSRLPLERAREDATGRLVYFTSNSRRSGHSGSA